MPFDDIPRTGISGKRQDEGDFDYLNTSARREAERVRAAIVEWLGNYPEHHRSELRARIRRSDFTSATFELFLHEACLKQGWGVEIHPTLPQGSSHPDFLVHTPQGSFYLEAVVAAQFSSSQEAAEKRKNEVLRAIDDMPSPHFMLEINPTGDPQQNVPRKRLKHELRRWLDSLDPEDIKQRYEARLELPEYRFEHAGWVIGFRPIPRRSSAAQGRRTIGVLGGGVRNVNVIPALRKAARAKASKYGDLDLPLVVAINLGERWADVTQERDALFGTLQIGIDPATGNATRYTRAPDGIWIGRAGPVYTRLSGVWVFRSLDVWHWAARDSNLVYMNPFERHTIPNSLTVFPHAEVVADELVERPGTPFHQLFGVSADWPSN